MSESVESILREVLQRREKLAPIAQDQCQVCRKEANFYRKDDTAIRFCGDMCNQAEYYASQLFQLGMKRVRELQIEELRLSQLPPEIQAHIILLIFDYRIEYYSEWQQLLRLKYLIDKHYQSLIETQVIPYFHYIESQVLSEMSEQEISRLVQLRRIQLTSAASYDWNRILRSMKELVDLDLSHQSSSIVIHTEKLTQLTRLVCGKEIQDANLEGLVNLRTLVLKKNSSITDQGLSHVTNLTKLDIESVSEEMAISRDGFNQLPYLQKLVLVDVTEEAVSGDHISGLTQLRNLHLEDTKIVHIETLTNLNVLYLYNNDEDAVMGESISKLVNLTKLSLDGGFLYHGLSELTQLLELNIKGGSSDLEENEIGQIFERLTNLEKLNLKENVEVGDNHLTLLVNLKSLNLRSNHIISDKGITSLTNLTFLNITGNPMITPMALGFLKNLRRIKESPTRTYKVENGVISLLKK